MTRTFRPQPTPVAAVAVLLLALPAFAQEEAEEAAGPEPAELVITPSELTLEVGSTATLEAEVRDADGSAMDRTVVFFSRRRRSVGVNPAGIVEAFRPGEHTLIAMVPKDPEDTDRRAEPAVMVEIPVTIPNPPVATVEVANLPGHLYAGTEIGLRSTVTDISGAVRSDVEVRWSSADPSVASVDALGTLALTGAGRTTITVSAEEASSDTAIEVLANPVASITLTGAPADAIRTGDVVFFEAKVTDAAGNEVPDYPVQFATLGVPADGIVAPGAIGQVDADGAFVAERSGTHTVIADGFTTSASATVAVTSRKVRKDVEIVGQGPVRDRYTSDLWVWEGTDGRDYAVTGTWGADGHAYFWDVTDPSAMSLIDTVRVDARTVNDVKVSEDGQFCVISREGASNRRNGLVILDVSDPQSGVQVIARYDDQLTGGVHNVFIAEDHIYALSAGRRFDILNAEDPENPYRVGRFELTHRHPTTCGWWTGSPIRPTGTTGSCGGRGGGGMGGAEQPGRPSGWNHAAYPYRSQSTGKFLMIGGDEAFPYQTIGEPDTPDRAAGWIHIYEWDEWEDAREVARYQVPEAGTHNLDVAARTTPLHRLLQRRPAGGGHLRRAAGARRGLPAGRRASSPTHRWSGGRSHKGRRRPPLGLWAVKLVDPEPVTWASRSRSRPGSS